MKVLYISPSVIPSKAANSVHVVMQCAALSEEDCSVTLFAQRSIHQKSHLKQTLKDAYGIDFSNIKIFTVYGKTARMANIKIASLLIPRLAKIGQFDLILSRNLYASWLIGVILRRRLMFETHQLEQGIRKWLQKSIMNAPLVTTIVISKQLKLALERHHKLKLDRSQILHDAAPAGMKRIPYHERRPLLESIFPKLSFKDLPVCGYFGHLYAGRGIEITIELASRHPQINFLIVGGNDETISQLQHEQGHLPNLFFTGHIPHQHARAAMAVCDILLMPYQKSVSIGVSGHDTASWMSPMKMFEYMGAGIPIISSDLPVLREILINEENCLMVEPDDASDWSDALMRIVKNRELADRLSTKAYSDYCNTHTWQERARRLIHAAVVP